MSQTSAIVLVHGAWGGAWVWRRVLSPLREAGHDVHAVTLTGCGERAHLRQRDTDLFTHIDDVLGLVENEELDNITLVGHSYAGQVITGVADRLLSQGTHRLRRLVYVDAMVPLPGEGWGSLHPAKVVAARQAAAMANNNALPSPDPRVFGIDGADRDWLLRRHVPHPFAPYRQPLPFDALGWAALPRTFVDCVAPAYPTIDEARLRVRQQPGWRIVEMPTGHFPMITMPEEFISILLQACQATASA